MIVTQLAVEIGQAFRCVLDDKGVIAKLGFPGADETEDEAQDEDPLARLDTEFVLLTGTVRELVETLERLLGRAETDAAEERPPATTTAAAL
jgi:DNA recombination-dependent growth factor C